MGIRGIKILPAAIFMLVAASVGLFCSSCGESSGVKRPSAEELRILSLVTAADHILSELGCGDKIAAIDRHGKILPAMADKAVIAVGSTISREMLHQYKINCAVVWYYQQELAEFLRKEGVFVYTVSPINLQTYCHLVDDLAELCGKKVAAEPLISKFDAAISGENNDTSVPVKVYMELYAPWKVPAIDSYIGAILSLAGGVQAVEPAGANISVVSPEAVAMAEVEAVFYVENFASAAEIISRPALRNSSAAKNKHIFAVPRELLCEGVAPERLLKFFKEKLQLLKDK
ncbi:MAG: hypothetical protein E7056_03905 [Lentisphaerae bacterium]|nr:hypothetical protein [Lentisphaerota bacterium]